VRGISDKANGEKYAVDAAGWQSVAAANAAAFAVALAAEVCIAPDPAAAHTRTRYSRAVHGTGPAPRQLPPRAGLFVGRAAQLARLDDVLLGPGGGPKIAVLTGMAGAGKTTLAAHWAHGASDSFPDGLLYLDVRGFGPDAPLPAYEILACFLRALGQSRAAERGSVDERAARLRTLLDGRRILLFLDNVGSVDQVRPVLPGSGSCAVLITSRRRLGGLAVQYGVQALEVDRLPLDESFELLRRAIGDRATAEPDQVRALAHRCAGLPLALRIAAERVAARPFEDLGPIVAELDRDSGALDALDTGDDGYSAVRTVFSWSYRGLTEPEAIAFRRLGLHPGNVFGMPAAVALLDLPVGSVRATLRSLVNAHLLAEPALDRFELHDLLRAYARELCAQVDDPDSRTSAYRRLFDQYVHTVDRADRVIMPHRYRVPLDGAPAVEVSFDGRQEALQWLDSERYSLVEICRLDSAEFDTRRWKLAYLLRDYFFLSKDLDGWLETHALALAGCTRLADRCAEAMTRNNLGRALLEAGRLDEAAAEYRLAQRLFEAEGDSHGRTDALVNLASILRRQGAYDEALRDQETALAYYRQAGLDRKVGITLRSIARTELALGRLAEAAEHANEALDLFVHLGLDLDAAQSLNTLGLLLHRLGRGEPAESAYRRAIRYSRQAGSGYEEARAWDGLGAVAAGAGQVAEARRRWSEALRIFQALGAPAAGAVASRLAAVSTGTPRPALPESSDVPSRRSEDQPA
jgi:tetratricopeptide (TPR) repeat protein